MTSSPTFIDALVVDFHALAVLAEVEAKLIENDILVTGPSPEGSRDAREEAHKLARRTLKERWLTDWRSVTDEFLRSSGNGVARVVSGDAEALDTCIQELREEPTRLPAYIVLLELATFDVYWPLLTQDPRSFAGVTVDRSAHDTFVATMSTKLGFPPERGRLMRLNAFEAYRDLLTVGSIAASVISKSRAGALAQRLSSLSSAAFGTSLVMPGSTMMNTRLAEDGLGAIAPGGVLDQSGTAALLCGGAIFSFEAQVQGQRTQQAVAVERITIAAAKFEALVRELLAQKQGPRSGIRDALLQYSAVIQWVEVQLIDELDRRGGDETDYGALRRGQQVLRRAFDRCVEAFNR